MSKSAPVRRRFSTGTTTADLKRYMGPFAERLGYKFNTDAGFVEEVLTSEIEILDSTGDVFCPCRMRTGDAKEDTKIICPCIPFHRDQFAGLKKCWCGLFILKEVDDGLELLGVIDEPEGPIDVAVFRVEDLPDGQIRHVKVGRQDVAVARVGQEFFALSNVCRHAFAPLGEGFMDGYHVMCPWHGWRYDVRDGSTDHPGANVKTYPVSVEDGEIRIRISPAR